MEQITNHTFKPPACHYIPIGKDREMAVSAMASIINTVRIAVFRNLKQPFFVKKKSPQMILQVEDCTGIFMLYEFLPYTVKKISVFTGGYMCGFLF